MTITRRRAPGLLVLLFLVTACQDRSEAASGSPDPAAAEADATDPAPRDPMPGNPMPGNPTPDDSPPGLTPDGWDGLRIGMTRAQVVAAAGEDAHPEAVGGPDPATCDEFRPNRTPEGLLVMILNGRLSRITVVDGPGIVTDHGIGVGDSLSAVEAAYGDQAVVSAHPFLPAPARFLTVWENAPSSPDARGIAHEVGREGRIVRILAGDESIEFREGCV